MCGAQCVHLRGNILVSSQPYLNYLRVISASQQVRSVRAYFFRKHKHKPRISGRLQRQRQVVQPGVSVCFLQRLSSTTNSRAKIASSKRDRASEQCIDGEEKIDDKNHCADAYERQFSFLTARFIAIRRLLQAEVFMEDHSVENDAEDIAHEADSYFRQERENLRAVNRSLTPLLHTSMEGLNTARCAVVTLPTLSNCLVCQRK